MVIFLSRGAIPGGGSGGGGVVSVPLTLVFPRIRLLGRPWVDPGRVPARDPVAVHRPTDVPIVESRSGLPGGRVVVVVRTVTPAVAFGGCSRRIQLE